MKKQLLLIIFFALLIFTSNAQSVNLEWVGQFAGSGNERGRSVVLDKAGNIYTVGELNASADFDPGTGVFNLYASGSTDVYISKLDPSGNFIWAKKVGGNGLDIPSAMAIDTSGNLYITGTFFGTADFDPGSQNYELTTGSITLYDTFILKLDSSGSFIWAKQIGGAGNDYANSLAIDVSGNIYVAGKFEGTSDFDPDAGIQNLTSAGSYDMYVLCLNNSGNFIWVKQMGGTGIDEISFISINNSGSVYLAGNFADTVDFDPGPGIYNLISKGLYNGFFSRLDASGNLIWVKQISCPVKSSGNSIITDPAGDIIVTGVFSDSVDIDPGLSTYNLFSSGNADIFISKWNSSGAFIWGKSIGGHSYDNINSAAMDAGGNIFIGGFFNDTADFDPGPLTYNLISNGIYDMFISKLNASGNLIWVKQMGASSFDECKSICVDAAGKIYTTGYFSGTVDFDPEAGMHNLTTLGNIGAFIHKMSDLTVGLAESTPEDSQIYPNPSMGILTLFIPEKNSKVEVINLRGQIIYASEKEDHGKTTIDLSANAKGIYFVKVTSGNTVVTEKLFFSKIKSSR